MDAALGFFGVQLSDNMAETPEGYLVCKNAVIGRTGTQTYRFSQLPQEEAAELGLTGSPDDEIDLHRDAEDVFDREFMASLEGKSVTDQHPDDLLDIDSVARHEKGTIHNVRRGDFTLDSGDEPLLADLMVKDRALKSKILGGLRELSCGYTFHIAKDGERVLQVGMTGNHVALVHAGRAGHEARVYDHRDPPKETVMPKKFAEMSVKERIAHLLGLGMRQVATDANADPGDLAHAAVAMDAAQRGTDERRSTRRRGGKGFDAQDRAGMHKLIDAMCDAADEDEEEGARKMKDAKSGLMKLLGGKANDADEDEAEEEDLAEVGDEDEEEDGEANDSEEDEEGEAHDESLDEEDKELGYEAILPVGDRPKPAAPGLDAKRGGKGKGATGKDSAMAFMKLLRPAVARSKDRKLRAAFDSAIKDLNGRSRTRPAGQGYGGFHAAAGATGKDGKEGAPSGTLDQQQTDFYAKRKAEKRAAQGK